MLRTISPLSLRTHVQLDTNTHILAVEEVNSHLNKTSAFCFWLWTRRFALAPSVYVCAHMHLCVCLYEFFFFFKEWGDIEWVGERKQAREREKERERETDIENEWGNKRKLGMVGGGERKGGSRYNKRLTGGLSSPHGADITALSLFFPVSISLIHSVSNSPFPSLRFGKISSSKQDLIMPIDKMSKYSFSRLEKKKNFLQLALTVRAHTHIQIQWQPK